MSFLLVLKVSEQILRRRGFFEHQDGDFLPIRAEGSKTYA